MLSAIFRYITTFSLLWYGGTISFLYKGLKSLKPADKAKNNRFSIVVAARNEEKHIGACLDSLLRQTIAAERFEIIVVNDRSTDATAEIIQTCMQHDSRIRLVTITETPEGLSPKKYAVSRGVIQARNDIIVFTDADCTVPPTWLDTIDRYFTPETGLVQGITSYERLPGMNRLFYALQSIDFISHGIVAASAIGAKLPINSNANNFAFRREAFNEVGGTTGKIGHVVSGDDDLLLQKIWKNGKWKIAFMADPKGAVTTRPTETMRELFGQRARWGSKTVHYSVKQVLLLAGVFLFYCVLAVSLLLSLFSRNFRIRAIRLLAAKCIGEAVLMFPGLKLFGKRQLIPCIPLASLLQLPLVLGAVLVGIFGKFTWKDQTFSRIITTTSTAQSPTSDPKQK